MYYSAGNFEAFAHPKKPEGLENKSAYIIGTGLAALTAAFYLVRDAQMPGKNIHVFDKDVVPGGALDGAFIKGEGYVMRGGREMDNHFRGHVGRLPRCAEHRRPECVDARPLLLAQQGGPELFEVPRHQGTWPQCAHRQQVQSLRQGVHGDPQALPRLRGRARQQEDHRLLRRRSAQFEFLAVLAHHVRLRELGFRARDASLHPPVHPSHRWPARLLGIAVHAIQPV